MSLIKKLNILNYNSKVFVSFIFIFLFFGFSVLPTSLAQEEKDRGSLEIHSDYCTIIFDGQVDYEKIDRNLSVRLISLNSADRELLKNTKNLTERIALKCDFILLRSEQILDMYPADFHVNIIIFKDKEKMINAHESIIGNREDLYSFYIYENNTIYTTQSRINQNLLAHEMGHAIVNYYFIIRPPHTVRELLSQYIDIHLED